jgi:hypothetical protein
MEERPEVNPSVDAVYREIAVNIRTTDEISFKLLKVVPATAGVGAGVLAVLERAALLNQPNQLAAGLIVLSLSLVGAIVTWGFYRWELRNIQRCDWLCDRAADIEHSEVRQFKGWRERTPKAGGGKAAAEALIYRAATAAWLIPPGVLLASRLCF